jgi:hypothetical protein
MERRAVYQEIAKQLDNSYSLAYIYFSIVFAVNSIRIPRRKLQLVAYISINGISSVSAKKGFCDLYKSSPATVGNMISELSKEGILIKENGKIRVHPDLSINFDRDVLLKVSLWNAHR